MPADFQTALTRASAALQRGHGAEAVQQLGLVLRSSSLRRDDELAVRCLLAEAWLLQDDIEQATAALGRPPDVLREHIEPARLAALWRLHARVAFARGDQSRAIALLGRSLKHAEQAHDSRAIGLAHYELGLCYKQVGELAIVREHIARAASALHAAGDRRHLALVHSLSGVTLAQGGRCEEASAALRQAEHLAAASGADDVLALVSGNQANVALMRHRHDQARALAERSLVLHETSGTSAHGLAVALATLGQISVKLGDLTHAEQVLNRALSIRTPIQAHETTGAVYDTLAQIHLIRGRYDEAEQCLVQAGVAYGGYGSRASKWYEWSIRLLSARLELRRGRAGEALAAACAIVESGAAPPGDVLQAQLLAAEALAAMARTTEAGELMSQVVGAIDPSVTPGVWGEYLRLRALLHADSGRLTDAYHDLAQSVSVFELLSERYHAGLSHLAVVRLVAPSGARSLAERHARKAAVVFEALGAKPDLDAVKAAIAAIPPVGTGEYVGSPADADDVVVRRLVDAAVLPELLALETAAAMQEGAGADAAVVFVAAGDGELRVVSHAGCDQAAALALARAALERNAYGHGILPLEPLGRNHEGPRFGTVASSSPLGHHARRRLRMIAAVASQGFQLCGARERSRPAPEVSTGYDLEKLMPGFVCASAAMGRVVEHIQRLQGNDLTVLVTGESGTGKELIARAIHLGSPRAGNLFLPYNCTTTTRDLADSQLFGHRRGSFTGAVADQQGLIRSATGGTLFLDEIGDLPLEVQPKLLRFLEQGEVMPIGETRPLRVDVRVIAVTNADLEQRVAEGRFREDLYYRLAVIRIHVPPLRERREEIPHLCAFFMRETCERLAKADIQLGSDVLDAFSEYWWPGNVRQLRNEIQRLVAMSPPGGVIGPDLLSPDILATRPRAIAAGTPGERPALRQAAAATLAQAVDALERDLIREALERSDGNISETARALGLTRRGLYLKLRRLGLDTAPCMDTR